MSTKTTYDTDYLPIYPGRYEAAPRREQELRNRIHDKKGKTTKPPMNIRECEHHYKVEMAAPGFTTEDFSIHTSGNMVNIAAFSNKRIAMAEGNFRKHDFEVSCIEQQLTLPKNADTNFATAEYREGILSMHFSKSGSHSMNQPGRIIVY